MNTISIYIKTLRLLAVCMFFVILSGCDTSGPSFSGTQFGSILEVDFPEELVFGETYIIPLKVSTPTECHTFKEISEIVNGVEYNVTAILLFQDFGNCQLTLDEPFETDYVLEVEREDRYEFLFFAGMSEENQPTYIRFNRDVVMP